MKILTFVIASNVISLSNHDWWIWGLGSLELMKILSELRGQLCAKADVVKLMQRTTLYFVLIDSG